MLEVDKNATMMSSGNGDDDEEDLSDEEYTSRLFHDIVVELCGVASDDVKVQYVEGDRLVLFVVRIRDKSKVARVIGVEGRTIRALRTLITAIGGSHGRIYRIEVSD